ncbi:hypothetical protein [Shimia sp. SDUM112013]|uniref:hypothetical protein n=1 Tax=Shimia sp. SDUM112013 TaxID=3136160 RepID=UPI0032ECBE1A
MKKAIIPTIVALSMPLTAQAAEWNYSASLYGWFPGLDSTIGTAFGDLDMDISAQDLISNLDMAFMGTFEGHNGQWGYLADIFYSDISTNKTGPFGFVSADLDLKLTLVSLAATYRVSETATSQVDLMGGLRGYDMDVGGQFNGGGNPTFGGSDKWVDPVIGLRGRWALSDQWSLTALGDVGGFGLGSDLSWQVLATFDYALNDSWLLRFGYRHLEVDKPINGRDVQVGLSGPIFGATYRF